MNLDILKRSYLQRGQNKAQAFLQNLNFSKNLDDLMILSLVWFGMVWYGLVWFGMVWYGLVWFGMVWYGFGFDYSVSPGPYF